MTDADTMAGVVGRQRPAVVVFDVNETLSDMSPTAGRFEDVGAPGHLATTWFAGLLRDGFALTATDSNEPFARVGTESLHVPLDGRSLDRKRADAVAHIMDGFDALTVHPDVDAGTKALADLGTRLVTLSNGSADVAEALLHRAEIATASSCCCRSRTPACGSPPRPPTPTPCSDATWHRPRPCWWPFTRGTSTGQPVPAWPRRGSTAAATATPPTSDRRPSRRRR